MNDERDRPSNRTSASDADGVDDRRRRPAEPQVRGVVTEHRGKYAPLHGWLRSQDGMRVTVSFAEIERAMSMPLPPSCRNHVAHWHSYEGSAVARAIIDAGWRSSNVDLVEQRVTFERVRR